MQTICTYHLGVIYAYIGVYMCGWVLCVRDERIYFRMYMDDFVYVNVCL